MARDYYGHFQKLLGDTAITDEWSHGCMVEWLNGRAVNGKC
jgi:hypothetical protein